jgi:[ribosomal protein S5]-alanine N-acetyltransferase
VLEDSAVRLRPLTTSDGPAWRELKDRNRAWLSRWEATVPPGDRSGRVSYRQMVRMLRGEALQGRMLPFAVDYSERLDDPFRSGTESAGGTVPSQRSSKFAKPADADHRLVGQLTVSGIAWGSLRSANVGYWVDENCAGRGVIPTAVALAVDHCFTVCGLHRVEVCIRPENMPSRRVVEKLGFREEGVRRAYLHIDGGWRDHITYALTAEEIPEGLLNRWHASRITPNGGRGA